jgi:phage terminase large subunit-like protein
VERPRGRYERLWAERQARMLELAAQPGGHPKSYTFDVDAGERVVQWVERFCRHHKGEWKGRPLLLEPWQRENIRQVFGWKRADGTRLYRTVYWEIPRKNGKSEMAGALGLYLQVGDQEPGAEVYASATKKDQAMIVWSTAAEIVKQSPDLKRNVRAYRRNLHCERLGSKFEPLGADSGTLDGLNPHGNIVDELHAHKDRDLWDVLETAMGARRQPMTLAITTAGTYDPEAIGWQTHDYAVKVLEGVFEDDAFHAYIASASEGEDTERILKEQPDYYFTEEAQRKANPNYGVSVKPDFLRKQAAEAQRQPTKLNAYLKLQLNIWTEQVNRWLSLADWARADPLAAGADARAVALERERALEGQSCRGGLDLASKMDLNALVLAFDGPKGVLDLLCRFWLPQGKLDEYARREQTKHFAQWAKEGWLVATPGNVTDYDFIEEEVRQLAKRYRLEELGYDPWNATQLAVHLLGDGIPMVEVGQGYKSLSEPAKELEARVASGRVRHSNNPVLRYCVSNAVVTTDAAGNIKPDKARASGRIDGVVASVMALSRIIRAPEGEGGKSVYQERGLVSL